MAKKLHIAVVCGGQSTEHEVSILSASNVVTELDRDRYDVAVIYISRSGAWHLLTDVQRFLQDGVAACLDNELYEPVTVALGQVKPLVSIKDCSKQYSIDCFFPMLHGTLGEDGTIQGLFEMLNVPYVGANVISSSICMEKHIAKQLLRDAGLPTTDWVAVNRNQLAEINYQQVTATLGECLFIKPASLGSSVGINKVTNQQQFEQALQDAFHYDADVLIEPCINGREVECSVLGNDNPTVSLPGEISTQHEFYSYEAKYCDPDSLTIQTPADLPASIVKQLQEVAVKAYQVLFCSGMARVDFFVVDNQQVLISEVNTIPGFTSLSMYPQNWQVSGLQYKDLLTELVQLAIQRYQDDRQYALILLPETKDQTIKNSIE